jgi:hypothetical protein
MVAHSCASCGNCLTDGEKLLRKNPVGDGMCPKIVSRETLPRLTRHGKSFEEYRTVRSALSRNGKVMWKPCMLREYD